MNEEKPDLERIRRKLTMHDMEELRTEEDVHHFLERDGTAMIVVNALDPEAGEVARRAVGKAVSREVRPDHLATFLADEDREPAETLRQEIGTRDLDAPAFYFFVNGELFKSISRSFIEKEKYSFPTLRDELNWTFDDLHAEGIKTD